MIHPMSASIKYKSPGYISVVLKVWLDSHGRRHGNYFQGCTGRRPPLLEPMQPGRHKWSTDSGKISKIGATISHFKAKMLQI